MSDAAVTTQANGADPGTLARIAVQRSKLRSAVNNLTTERDTLRTENSRLLAENQMLKVSADTGASQKRVKELEQQIRERDHKEAFKSAAKKAGIPDDRTEAAWKLSGYKADGELNEDAINSAMDGLKESSAFLFGEAPPADDGAPPTKPATGGGQGGRNKKSISDDVIIPANDPRWNDAGWQMTHREEIIASSREKLRRGIVEEI